MGEEGEAHLLDAPARHPPADGSNARAARRRTRLRRDARQADRDRDAVPAASQQAVAREREEVARLAKALYARKDELEGILKTHLKDKDELVLGGVRYRMFATTSIDYPIEPTLTLLGDATGLSREELLGKLGAVDKKALDALLKSLGKKLDKPRVSLLKAELEAHADKTHSPRFWAKEVAA